MWLKKFSDAINRAVMQLLWVLMAAMVMVVFAQVIFRLAKSSLPWSEELARYLMVYLVFLGTSVGVKRGSHIAVEVVANLLPEKLSKAADVLAALLSMAFFAVLLIYGSKVVVLTLNQTSPAMKLKMGYIYASIVISAALMIIHSLSNIVEMFTGGEEAGIDGQS